MRSFLLLSLTTFLATSMAIADDDPLPPGVSEPQQNDFFQPGNLAACKGYYLLRDKTKKLEWRGNPIWFKAQTGANQARFCADRSSWRFWSPTIYNGQIIDHTILQLVEAGDGRWGGGACSNKYYTEIYIPIPTKWPARVDVPDGNPDDATWSAAIQVFPVGTVRVDANPLKKKVLAANDREIADIIDSCNRNPRRCPCIR